MQSVTRNICGGSSPATVCQPSAENALLARKADPFIHARDSERDSPFDGIDYGSTSSCVESRSAWAHHGPFATPRDVNKCSRDSGIDIRNVLTPRPLEGRHSLRRSRQCLEPFIKECGRHTEQAVSFGAAVQAAILTCEGAKRCPTDIKLGRSSRAGSSGKPMIWRTAKRVKAYHPEKVSSMVLARC